MCKCHTNSQRPTGRLAQLAVVSPPSSVTTSPVM